MLSESLTAAGPRHVAIILDGNGRWAKARGLSRSEGHRAGGQALHQMLDSFLAAGIECVSLYAFSSENWKRPPAEVAFLWRLMEEFFGRHVDECRQKGIRIVSSGDLSALPESNQRILRMCDERTRDCKRLTANFCVNYGSHEEICRAATAVVRERIGRCSGESGEAQEAARVPVTVAEIEAHLDTAGLPPVDLLIRPGGESRVSNFLLWQIAYAELYFTDTFWPDFSAGDLQTALEWFAARERRFGGLAEGGRSDDAG